MNALVESAKMEPDAKKPFIEAFFADLNDKVRYLEVLCGQRRNDEALILCCAYLDGLGNWLSGSSPGSARNFCDVLINHSGESTLSLLLPARLVDRLPWKSAPPAAERFLRPKLVSLPDCDAYQRDEFLNLLSGSIPAEVLQWLESELWRLSIANVAFSEIRSLNVHSLGSADALTFTKSTYHGGAIAAVDFPMLYRALNKIVLYAQQLSLQTNKWFGHH